MDVQVILLDIEGTVCPISFVKDVLFPYALKALPETLDAKWDDPDFAPYRNAFPPEHRTTKDAFTTHVHALMSLDLKISYLKALQGYLWQSGYSSGALASILFPDVYPFLASCHASNIPLIIYSSGSVPAQKLLFKHTNTVSKSDLNPLLSGYFDTVNAGLKTHRGSYEKIAETRKAERGKWLFLSDNVKEVRAAREAGMQAMVVVREGNPPLSDEEREGQAIIHSFDEIKIRGKEETA